MLLATPYSKLEGAADVQVDTPEIDRGGLVATIKAFSPEDTTELDVLIETTYQRLEREFVQKIGLHRQVTDLCREDFARGTVYFGLKLHLVGIEREDPVVELIIPATVFKPDPYLVALARRFKDQGIRLLASTFYARQSKVRY